ncbi:FAD-binding oxidoreductase [Elongatibacter sediminis]
MKRRQFCGVSVGAAVAAALPGGPAFAATARAIASGGADVNAVTGAGAQVTLSRASIDELAGQLRGNLLLPGNEAYEDARLLLNPSFDKHPALVVQPRGAADVQQAVDFARAHELLVAVKCGGHSASGKSSCDGGMQIDLSLLRFARVDPQARTALMGGGSLLGELDHEAMAQGLVTTAGTVSHTGVGGLTLGGGFGRVARRYGLALDNVRSVEIVTADGRLRHASAEHNPDLYWGVRGGGGNFGVVTAFEFNLHPMSRQVVAGRLVYPFAQARQLLEFYGEYGASCPDDLYLDAVMAGPPGGAEPVFMFSIVWIGDPGRADEVLAPLRRAGTVLNESIKTWDYVALQRSGDIDDPRASGSYIKGAFLPGIDSEVARRIVEAFEPHPGRSTVAAFQHSGGAINRVPADATAFPHRDAMTNLFTMVGWPFGNESAEHIAYVKSYWQGIEDVTRGFYANDARDENQAEVDHNYLGNYDRLVTIKDRYDPTNLFRLNANIRPSGAAGRARRVAA